MKKRYWKTWQDFVNECESSNIPRDQVIVEVNKHLDELEAFVMWVARDYVESSHDKVRWQRDDYIKRAKELIDKLYDD